MSDEMAITFIILIVLSPLTIWKLIELADMGLSSYQETYRELFEEVSTHNKDDL